MNEFKTHIDSGTQHNTICEWIMPFGRYLAKIPFNIQDDVVIAHFSLTSFFCGSKPQKPCATTRTLD